MELMRYIILFTLFSMLSFGSYAQVAIVSKPDNVFSIYQDRDPGGDYAIFGYEQPNKESKKMICFSNLTDQVENNPNKCELGSYYDTSMLEFLEIYFISSTDDFAKLKLVKNGNEYVFYMQMKEITFR